MRADNKDFIFFDNAYSSYVQTVPTLERALSERNKYDDRPFLDSANILDVAKKLVTQLLGLVTKVYSVNMIQLFR